jgi:hypothetical protein
MNHRIIHIESILRQERHLLAQSEIVKLETELQQLRNQTMKHKQIKSKKEQSYISYQLKRLRLYIKRLFMKELNK